MIGLGSEVQARVRVRGAGYGLGLQLRVRGLLATTSHSIAPSTPEAVDRTEAQLRHSEEAREALEAELRALQQVQGGY